MDGKKKELSRREMLQAAAVASFGTALLNPTQLAAQQQNTANVIEGKGGNDILTAGQSITRMLGGPGSDKFKNVDANDTTKQ